MRVVNFRWRSVESAAASYLRCAAIASIVCGALSVSASELAAQIPVYVKIPVGTRIPVVTLDELSSKNSKKGTKLNLSIVENIIIDGRTVIAKGAPIWGVVAEAKKAGRFDSDGALNIRLDSTKTTDGKTVQLLANLRDTAPGEEHKSQVGENAKKVVDALPGGELATGFFKRGDDFVVAAKSPIAIYTASYVVMQFVDSSDAAMDVEVSDAPPEAEDAIILFDGIQTWGRSLGVLAAYLGSTPQIRALGEQMIKDHVALQAEGSAVAKKHHIAMQPLVPADQTRLNESITEIRAAKPADADQMILSKIHDLSVNVIKAFGDNETAVTKDLFMKAAAAWGAHMQTAAKLLTGKK